MKRGSVTKEQARLINVWIPTNLLPPIDRAVDKLDTDRSKFIRLAIREKLSRHGVEEAA